MGGTPWQPHSWETQGSSDSWLRWRTPRWPGQTSLRPNSSWVTSINLPSFFLFHLMGFALWSEGSPSLRSFSFPFSLKSISPKILSTLLTLASSQRTPVKITFTLLHMIEVYCFDYSIMWVYSMSGDMSIDDTSSYIHDCLFPLFLDFAVVKNIAINTSCICSIIYSNIYLEMRWLDHRVVVWLTFKVMLNYSVKSLHTFTPIGKLRKILWIHILQYLVQLGFLIFAN